METIASMAETTTIEITRDVWRELNARKYPGDSFNDVLERLLRDGEADDTRTRERTDNQKQDVRDESGGEWSAEQREAIHAARDFLRERETATMREFVLEVMPDHPAGYDLPDLDAIRNGDKRFKGAWWRSVVKPGLKELDEVEAPDPGRSEWRWVG